MTLAAESPEEAAPQAFPMEEFLDRLTIAESGGRLRRKNPRSTALGPFQFIESTFLLVVKKSYTSEVAGLTERQILALRTNLAFSRRAAAAYANDLISALESDGLPATPANVRLAFLIGPSAAVRLLRTPPDQPLEKVLSADAVAANPYMSGATVAELVRKAAADVGAAEATGQLGAAGEPAATTPGPVGEPADVAALASGPIAAVVAANIQPTATLVALEGGHAGAPVASNGEPKATASPGAPIEIKCDVGLASCRKWIALRERKAQLLAQGAQP
jgi:hypothetical protein